MVGQELTNQRLDLTVEGCREQQTLSVCGGLTEDRANLGQEAHVRHLIGFVECGDFHRVEDAGALTQVVAETTRRCDEDVYAAAKLIHLLGERRSTDSGANRESECSGVGVEGVDHLESKLTGGDEHEVRGDAWRPGDLRGVRGGSASAGPKARVLPDPVCARPRTLVPASASGMDCAWMGDGTVMELRANAATSCFGQADLGEGDTRLGGDCFFGSGGC